MLPTDRHKINILWCFSTVAALTTMQPLKLWPHFVQNMEILQNGNDLTNHEQKTHFFVFVWIDIKDKLLWWNIFLKGFIAQ